MTSVISESALLLWDFGSLFLSFPWGFSAFFTLGPGIQLGPVDTGV
jgi:hypothetical protein